MFKLNDVEALTKKYGSPVYIFDEKEFVANYKYLVKCFRKVYSKYNLSYSYKTNYTPYVCKLVKSLGGYAEVVSDMEYQLAKKIGYSNDQIIYNGPAKGGCMEEHLLEGGLVNIDNYDEAIRISHLAQQYPERKIKVNLRINLDVGQNFVSRFGMEPESEELNNTLKVLRRHFNISIKGVHCHISRARGIEAWKKRVNIMLKAADLYVDGVPEYISLGSGMFGSMSEEMKKQFDTHLPTYEEYALNVLKPIEEHYSYLEDDEKPMVFTEPGTTVVAKYFSFLTKVLNIKNVRGRNIATTDGSFYNLGEICQLKKLPFEVINDKEDKDEFDDIDIMGYTCLEQDLMYESYSGKLGKGDYLVFENVGGYSIVSKPQFIQPNCAGIVLREDGTTEEIMRRECFNDVFDKFQF